MRDEHEPREGRIGEVLVRYSSDVITILEADGTIRYESPAVERVLGYAPGERAGEDALSYVHPDDLRAARVGLGGILEGARVGEPTEVRTRHKDGSWRWVEGVANNLLADPDVRGIVANFRDVTERKRAEESLRLSEGRFRGAFEDAPIGMALVGLDRRYLRVNRALCEILGYAEGGLLGKSAAEVTHPDDREAEEALRGRVIRGEADAGGGAEGGAARGGFEKRYLRADGSVVRALLSVSLVRDAEGAPSHFVVQVQDITERREAEERLGRSEKNLAEAQRLARLGSWELDLATRAVWWSEESYRIFGLPQGTDVDEARFGALVHPEDRGRLRAAFGAALEGEGDGYEAEYRAVRPDGSERVVHTRGRVVRDARGGPRAVVGTYHDVTERKALEGRLVRRATHDALTGLPNRVLYSERLAEGLARAERRGGCAAVLFVDLDNFKYVNDTLGHGAGDELLVAVAGRLRAALRPGDTVARLGGDEFAVLVECVSGAGEAERVAERMTGALAGPFAVAGREVFVTPSIGVTLARTGRGASPEDLMREADLALYEAKSGGKARHEVFGPATEARVVERLGLENDLRRAASDPAREFEVRYQPILRLGDTGRTGEGGPGADGGGRAVVGFEALLRWRHPERGLLVPGAFLALAEELGLTVPIGRWLLGEACRRAKEWQERHPGIAPLAVGANVSLKQISDPDLPADALAACRGAGLSPGQVTLEITEHAVLEDGGRPVEVLRELREAGFLLALDDFGVGYSSLSYLRRLPVGMVKLDRSFLEGLGEGGREEDEVLVGGVVGIAHGLGLLACAEGVETEEQRGRVEALGCDFAQGNLFAGPLGAGEASAFLGRSLPH